MLISMPFKNNINNLNIISRLSNYRAHLFPPLRAHSGAKYPKHIDSLRLHIENQTLACLNIKCDHGKLT